MWQYLFHTARENPVLKILRFYCAVVAHAFNLSTQEAEEFEVSLVYRVSFSAARATQKSCLKTNKKKILCF